MGYTHYWRTVAALPKGKWAAFTKDVRAILEVAPCKLARDYDGALAKQAPHVSDLTIRFNGVGAEGYETFYFTRQAPDGGMGFCKTDARAYDPVVCAVLLAADHHFGAAVKVSSDGRWAEWAEGAELYRKATGREPVKPAEVRE